MDNINETIQPEQTQEELRELLQIRRDKLTALQQAGRDPFREIRFDRDSCAQDILDNFETLENQTVRIAGRIMSKRDMGKASFADLRDKSGKMQLYVKIDGLGEDAYQAFMKLDIGDIVGVEGTVFRTRRGEISVQVSRYTLLSKSLLPLPEKFHGLKDTDTRYRQRYVDLMINPEVRDTFIKRSRIVRIIQREMDARGYLEVETPVLQNKPTNSAARPFKTHHNTLDIDMYLRVETELALKRLIVGGLEKVYEIGRLFRNEGMSTRHNPEFTTIELYEAYADRAVMMEIAEHLFATIALEICGGSMVTYQGTELDFSAPFKRITMADCVKEHSGLDFMALATDEAAFEAVKAIGLEPTKGATWGELMAYVFDERCEEHLVQPTFLLDYPIEISPLTKKTDYDPRLVERFELFAYGREVANAYTELNDPIDQRERFVQQAQIKNGEGQFEIDEDFVTAMEYGMPPTGGMGIGIDRMVMFFTDSASIRDVLLFPTMKPLD